MPGLRRRHPAPYALTPGIKHLGRLKIAERSIQESRQTAYLVTKSVTSSKCCFVALSADLARSLPSSLDPGKVAIFKVEWQKGVAFVSWSGDVTVNRSASIGPAQSSVLEIGRKFADLNGLQDKEQVVLTLVDRTSTPSCARVDVDPFSPDDWEILELHAGFIESNLLDQVRVVWRGQVIPIWINKNTCVLITIGETEPSAACVVLEEFTEVIIAPKQRNFSSSKKSELSTAVKRGQQSTSQIREKENSTSKGQGTKSLHTTKNVSSSNPHKSNSEDTYSSKVYHWWNYFLHGEEIKGSELFQDESTGQPVDMEKNCIVNGFVDGAKRNCCRNTFEMAELDVCLRNQIGTNICSKMIEKQEKSDERAETFLEQFTVFVHPSTVGFHKLNCHKKHSIMFPEDYEGLAKTVLIKKVLSPRERVELLNIGKGKSKGNVNSQGNQEAKEMESKLEKCINPAIVKMVLSKDTLPGHISINTLLQRQLGSEGMSRFQINHVTYEPQDVQGIILHPIRYTIARIEEFGPDVALGSFCTWVCQTCSEASPLVIWNGATITYSCQGSHLEVIVTILSHNPSTSSPDNMPYYKIMPSTLDRIKVVIGEVKSIPKGVTDLLQILTDNKMQFCCGIKDLGGFGEPFKKCMNHLLVSLTKDPLSSVLSGGLTDGLGNGAVLICGSGAHVGEGCGKTSLAHALCHQLQQWPVCANVTIMDCIPLRGKRVETIQKQWQQAFTEAAWYQPSVILLDNLDHVISAPNLTQEMGGEGFYRKRLVEVFKDLLATEVTNSSSIAIIATGRSQHSLHMALRSGRGSHIFQCCVELGALSEQQRTEVLSVIIKRKFKNVCQQELDPILKFVAEKSDGFSPKDLSRLTDRALHFSVIRKTDKARESSHCCLALEDFNQALSGFIPASLQGVHLHKASELSWSDVGGMHDVKEALKETLLWPSKYRKIFSKCPLRLRSGLLLYGPPGTGKTLLAGVVAKESGLNFISIKGPELLSKYIGASEQAVRDVFTRAQTAKPCILFFDEFDSLAPRRGHDSTGVTDRVVNQLLTQLDGVEGLEGVYVLAATSRPGLIDPALLRPGRLDKCVYCPIPNECDRLEILLALTRNLPLADDVNLETLSTKCEHFTGADLKALLYNAQLEAIHRTTSKAKLYGNVFCTKEETKMLQVPKEDTKETRKQLSEIQDVLAFTLKGGKKSLSREDLEIIDSEISVLKEKHSMLKMLVKSGKKENVVYLTQSDLNKAASMMKPSVSPSERLVYQNLYDSFMKSRGGSFTKNLPVEGKATLA